MSSVIIFTKITIGGLRILLLTDIKSHSNAEHIITSP